MSFLQVPTDTTSAKSFASPNLFENTSSSSSMSVPKNHHNRKNQYRMRICDAPPELLELIKRSEEHKKTSPNESSSIINVSNVVKSERMNEKPLPNKSPSSISTISNVVKSNVSTSNDPKIPSFRKTKCKFRKNPYPKKAPSRSSSGITLQVDISSTLKKDPKPLLRHSTSGISSDTKSHPPQSPISQRSSIKRQITKIKTTTNSLARVMAVLGLLNSPTATAAEIKLPYKAVVPPPPPMQFDDLIMNIEKLNLDVTMLNQTTPNVTGRGEPYCMLIFPLSDSLHPNEAHVASILRLTPLEYLAAKHTLISSARRYAQKCLPFRKSDAQKLLRINVNKASQLWEFFKQVNWIY